MPEGRWRLEGRPEGHDFECLSAFDKPKAGPPPRPGRCIGAAGDEAATCPRRLEMQVLRYSMISTSHSSDVLECRSGNFRIWSLCDGYLDMPAGLLRDLENSPVPSAATAARFRLSVNCFALEGPGVDGVLIDCGGGSWAPTLGRLAQSLKAAGLSPSAIRVLALTHAHQDHTHGLLTPDGQAALPNLSAIMLPAEAVESFRSERRLAPFHHLVRPLQNGDRLSEHLRTVALPGHANGHCGYALDTEEDLFLFFGDIVHVPALQFANPTLSWGYDENQATARATRFGVFDEAARNGTWIAGAHLDRPGIGRVISRGEGFHFEPAGR